MIKSICCQYKNFLRFRNKIFQFYAYCIQTDRGLIKNGQRLKQGGGLSLSAPPPLPEQIPIYIPDPDCIGLTSLIIMKMIIYSTYVQTTNAVHKASCIEVYYQCGVQDTRYVHLCIVHSRAVLRIRIRWIRKILASWIRIRKNIRIQGVKYQPKTAK